MFNVDKPKPKLIVYLTYVTEQNQNVWKTTIKLHTEVGNFLPSNDTYVKVLHSGNFPRYFLQENQNFQDFVRFLPFKTIYVDLTLCPRLYQNVKINYYDPQFYS
jgi:hypothetical protein